MAGPLVDSHCHLADTAFDQDRDAVIERARGAGLSHALCILAADDARETAMAPMLSGLWGGVRFAAGVHPHQAGAFEGRAGEAADLVRRTLDTAPHVVALGEIGLDYHYDFAPRPSQHEVLRTQLRLARERDLPVVIHTREAEDDTLAILREESDGMLRGVLHCFTGTRRLAEEGLALGLHVSFAGIVTFPKAAELRAVAAMVPADRLLAETDSPYLAPVPHRGTRNEPAHVGAVVAALAAVRHVEIESLQQAIAANFVALFRP